jgi:hypothetical protein
MERQINATTALKSTATVELDTLNNVWYVSDIDLVLGKVDVNNRFIPVQGREFTGEMLKAISTIMVQANTPKK